jgi:hypothetical protein
MGKPRALGVTDEREVLDEVGHRRRRALHRAGRGRHMLHPFLTRLEEIGEVGDAKGIEIGVLGSHGAFPARGRAAALSSVNVLEVLDPPVAALGSP